MALNYYQQSVLEKLAAKAPGATPAGLPPRRSDLAGVVYGGRGNTFDELKYLRGQNADSPGVNRSDSDAWHKFTTGQGVVASRADQERREFFVEKTFP